jgi:hypothetical protein
MANEKGKNLKKLYEYFLANSTKTSTSKVFVVGKFYEKKNYE